MKIELKVKTSKTAKECLKKRSQTLARGKGMRTALQSLHLVSINKQALVTNERQRGDVELFNFKSRISYSFI